MSKDPRYLNQIGGLRRQIPDQQRDLIRQQYPRVWGLIREVGCYNLPIDSLSEVRAALRAVGLYGAGTGRRLDVKYRGPRQQALRAGRGSPEMMLKVLTTPPQRLRLRLHSECPREFADTYTLYLNFSYR